jgi:NADH-quinone oxidoreductase subunit C/D
MHSFLESLLNRFPQAVITAQQDPERLDLWAQVKAHNWKDIAQFLHDDPSMALDHITDICSADYPDDLERFEIIYHFLSLPHGTRLRIKARVTEDHPEIASISHIWQGANFLEREVYDLMGIRFSGHPDLRRILMPEDYDEGYPLRKDFPAEGRGWRSRFEFLPKLDEPVGEWSESEVPEDQRHQFMADDRPGESTRKTELLLNMGPQHPSTHGVLRVILELDGERVTKAIPDLGYLHRGVEKLAEGLTYMQMLPHTDRLDYVCAMTNNYAYVRAVEKLINMTVPERAEYVRTIIAEMQRIVGHLFWLGTQALDIGAMTVFFWTFREREVLLDLFEKLCGARLTLNYYRIGGVDADLTPEIISALRNFLKTFPEHIREYDTLLQKNRIWVARTKGVAILSAVDAINFGCTGPVLRGSGVAYDIRKLEPYGVYDRVEWEVPLGKDGDTYDRYWVRMEEMWQSARIAWINCLTDPLWVSMLK